MQLGPFYYLKNKQIHLHLKLQLFFHYIGWLKAEIHGPKSIGSGPGPKKIEKFRTKTDQKSLRNPGPRKKISGRTRTNKVLKIADLFGRSVDPWQEVNIRHPEKFHLIVSKPFSSKNHFGLNVFGNLIRNIFKHLRAIIRIIREKFIFDKMTNLIKIPILLNLLRF